MLERSVRPLMSTEFVVNEEVDGDVLTDTRTSQAFFSRTIGLFLPYYDLTVNTSHLPRTIQCLRPAECVCK